MQPTTMNPIRMKITTRKSSVTWKAIAASCCMVTSLSAATFGKFTYTDDGTSVAITRYSSDAVGALEIPATIADKPVTSIANEAFEFCRGLTTITIPAGVTSIGFNAFEHCEGLTTITIPTGVTSIGRGAFFGCEKLTQVTIPSSVVSIGDALFDACASLTSVTISEGVATIGNYAFQGCSSLTSITIPSSVTRIAESAFGLCTSLTAITVAPLNSTYSSSDGVLFDKNQTKLILCPVGKAGIVTIPPRVTSIGDGAFGNCTKLTNVTIPASTTRIGNYAFILCGSLTGITVDIHNSAFVSLDGVLFDKHKTTLIQCPGGKTGSVTIPTGVTSIGPAAFAYCKSLTSVTIPSGVASIGDLAFQDCSSLTSVTIPSGVTMIGSLAFHNCRSLKSASFLGNAPKMGSRVFDHTASDFTVHYVNGKAGFTSPKWHDYTAVTTGKPILTDAIEQSPLEVWESMRKCVKDGDFDKAASYFVNKRREAYRTSFKKMGKKEAYDMVSGFVSYNEWMKNDELAGYTARTKDDDKDSPGFPLNFEKENGEWKILEF
jgi:BspA type Leucine rich repeat region (6 copies)